MSAVTRNVTRQAVQILIVVENAVQHTDFIGAARGIRTPDPLITNVIFMVSRRFLPFHSVSKYLLFQNDKLDRHS
ncbi:protein of unknown function [Methylocella tundrae]|uniref:Uncharacterized protein n=1 Tax=Methylocella tundrae TaxID=227605 RepID=A0A4U8Z5J2_METTU|nr:protein of unknown function [Methylocella tundrae]